MTGKRPGPRSAVAIPRIGRAVEIQGDSIDEGVVGVDGCSEPLWREG